MASLSFLSIDISFDNRKFFATCCVIVEAPSSLRDDKMLEILFTTALNTPFASTPGCLKKFLSSADKKEFTTTRGIELYGTNILFSEENSLNNCHH